MNPDGSLSEKSGRYFNVDLRVTKTFNFGERSRFKVYADLYNLFNTENLYFGSNGRLGLSTATAAATFHAGLVALRPGLRPAGGPSVHRRVRRALRLLDHRSQSYRTGAWRLSPGLRSRPLGDRALSSAV